MSEEDNKNEDLKEEIKTELRKELKAEFCFNRCMFILIIFFISCFFGFGIYAFYRCSTDYEMKANQDALKILKEKSIKQAKQDNTSKTDSSKSGPIND